MINKLNILNLVFYIINIVVTYGVGNLGWLGTPDNGELSDKYQTLVTPNSSAFLIWSLIFTAQLIFAIAQLFPRIGEKKMVLEGVKYYYLSVCVFQAAWTIAFAFEQIELSLIFMLLIWSSLVGLLISQYYTESEGTLVEFWLLRFPFSVHCGWLTAASALNVNVVVVDIDPPADIQLAVGIISLAVLHAISVWVIFGFQRPNYTIAGVLSWATYYIYAELQQPRDQIVERFSSDLISGVSYASLAVAAIIGLQIVVRIPYDVHARVCKQRRSFKEESSDEPSEPNDKRRSTHVIQSGDFTDSDV